MKCIECNHCTEDGFCVNIGSMHVFEGTGEFYCEIQGQLHPLGGLEEIRSKECIHRKCIKCGRPDPRVNNQTHEFCTECMAAIPREPDVPLVINWSEIIEKR